MVAGPRDPRASSQRARFQRRPVILQIVDDVLDDFHWDIATDGDNLPVADALLQVRCEQWYLGRHPVNLTFFSSLL